MISAGASSFIAGNAGADVINVSGALQDNISIRGGSGNDTVQIFTGGALAGISAEILLGDGADSITLDGAFATGANASSFIVAGGAGADSITFSGDVATGGNTLGTLKFSALSDSNLAATDVVDINTTAGGTSSAEMHFDFNNSATVDAVTNLSALVLFNSNTNYATLSTGGIVTFNGDLAVSSVTASMATVDKLTLSDGVGATALFKTAGGSSYLFMQGGTTGTGDMVWSKSSTLPVVLFTPRTILQSPLCSAEFSD